MEERLLLGAGLRLKDQAGFSLIELMVSVGIVAIAFILSLDQIFAINGLHKRIEAQNHARMDAKLITDYLARELREAGGNFVRPYMALWVENNCGPRAGMPSCNGSDRVSYAHIDRNFASCRVTVAENPDRLNFDSGATHCCSPQMNGRQIIMVVGGNFGSYYTTNSFHDESSNQCWVTVTPGQLSGLNAGNIPANFTDWSGADFAVVRATTVFVDPAARELKSFSDLNNNGAIDADEDILLADQVIDLQFLLGYDTTPQDGRIENQNNDQDEWQYNADSPNDVLGRGGLATATARDLRMIGLGIITEAKHYGQNQTLRLFDGPERNIADAQLTAAQSRIYLRSTLIYNN